MPDYQKRVIEEKAELDAKRLALRVALVMRRFPWRFRMLLILQAVTMKAYSLVLGERIKTFDKSSEKE